jgi:dual oxidase
MASSRSLTEMRSPADSVRDAIIGDDDITTLTDSEIREFLDDLDHNSDGNISYSEIEAKLDQVHAEISPNPLPHNLNHNEKEDAARHAFLRSLIGVDSGSIPRAEMEQRLKEWGIPSTKQEKEGEEAEAEYLRRFTWVRSFRSYWSVRGPEIMFIALVVSMMLAFGLWRESNVLYLDTCQTFSMLMV